MIGIPYDISSIGKAVDSLKRVIWGSEHAYSDEIRSTAWAHFEAASMRHKKFDFKQIVSEAIATIDAWDRSYRIRPDVAGAAIRLLDDAFRRVGGWNRPAPPMGMRLQAQRMRRSR